MGLKKQPKEQYLWAWGKNNIGQLGDDTVARKSSPVQTIAGGTDWKELDVSTISHSAGIKTNGTLWTWGENGSGELGDDTIIDKTSPVQTIAGGNDWTKIACGSKHTAAIKTNGTLWLWGDTVQGQLGENVAVTLDRSSPVQTVTGGINWKEVSCGDFHTSGIKTDGTLWSWGQNDSGQLSDDTVVTKSSPVQTIASGTDWKEVSCGYRHSHGIKTDGTLWNWGSGTNGELGDNTTTSKSSPVQTIAGGTDWTQVNSSNKHVAAIKADNTLWLWGWGTSGQLGDNTTTSKSSPVQMITGGSWKRASVGINHTAAIKTDGTLWSCGYGPFGNLGDNTIVSKSSPVQEISASTDWKEVKCGYAFTIAIEDRKNHELWASGYGSYGVLGDGTIVSKSSPVQTISGAADWETISGGQSHSVGIKNDGTLWTWGSSNYGQLGNNSTASSESSPIQTVTGGNDWKLPAAANLFSAGIKTDGTLWMWGADFYGQLGRNTLDVHMSSPVQTIAGGTNWAHVAIGYNHAAAIKTDGTLWNWGENYDGQLGDNDNGFSAKKSSPVQTVTGGTDWKIAATISQGTAAIKTDGTLWTWGGGSYGALGDNTNISKSSPVQTVTGGNDWKIIAGGVWHYAAIKTDGTLWTWGYNINGQLGDGTIIKRSSPVQTLTGGNDWAKCAAGRVVIRAIKTDGTLWTWGGNDNGELAIGTIIKKSSPVQTVAGGNNWENVFDGYRHMLATKKTNITAGTEYFADAYVRKEFFQQGNMWGCGYNYFGQLGDNTVIYRSSPVQTVAGGSNWKKLGSALFTMSGIKTDGTLWTWGYGANGALGDNTTTWKSSPVQTIAGGNDWVSLGESQDHSIRAIKTDGSMWVWGRNQYGTLGDDTVVNKSSPVQIGGNIWLMSSCGYSHSASLETDGTLWLSGRNQIGQLGDDTILNKSSPVQTVTTGANWKLVTAGFYHTAAIKTDGTLWGWGYNTQGTLGDGTTVSKSSPVQTIAGGTDWRSLGAGKYFTAATKTDGTLWAWGDGAAGALGDNTSVDKSSPVQTIAGGTDWKKISCGYQSYMSAIKTDGTLWNWGANANGTLGDGTTVTKSSPVQTIMSGNNWTEVAACSSIGYIQAPDD